jgi:TonB family protein
MRIFHKALAFTLLVHAVVFLSLTFYPSGLTRKPPTVYHVSLFMGPGSGPGAGPGPGGGEPGGGKGLQDQSKSPGPPEGKGTGLIQEKPKETPPAEVPKKAEAKPASEKKERMVQIPDEKPVEEKKPEKKAKTEEVNKEEFQIREGESLVHVQKSINEIKKKVAKEEKREKQSLAKVQGAIEEIRKKAARGGQKDNSGSSTGSTAEESGVNIQGNTGGASTSGGGEGGWGTGTGGGWGEGSGSGSGSGGGSGWGGGGGGGGGNPYFNAVAARIQENWTLLKNNMENVGSLTTDIGLQIERSGEITQIAIEKPSGNAKFDEFALRAVRKANPLPPLPQEFTEGRLEITVRLSS